MYDTGQINQSQESRTQNWARYESREERMTDAVFSGMPWEFRRRYFIWYVKEHVRQHIQGDKGETESKLFVFTSIDFPNAQAKVNRVTHVTMS